MVVAVNDQSSMLVNIENSSVIPLETHHLERIVMDSVTVTCFSLKTVIKYSLSQE